MYARRVRVPGRSKLHLAQGTILESPDLRYPYKRCTPLTPQTSMRRAPRRAQDLHRMVYENKIIASINAQVKVFHMDKQHKISTK